jgi:protein ImuA
MFSASSTAKTLPAMFKHGLASAAVHEIRAPEQNAGHVAFAVFFLAKFPSARPILWVSPQPLAYPPGLAWAGLDTARCIFAQAKDDDESLGALEVALRGGMAGVAECDRISRLAARRLALAAKTGGGIGFVLRHAPAFTAQDSTAFATRWMIQPAPDRHIRAALLYAKNAQPGVFMLALKGGEDAPTPVLIDLPAAPASRRAG